MRRFFRIRKDMLSHPYYLHKQTKSARSIGLTRELESNALFAASLGRNTLSYGQFVRAGSAHPMRGACKQEKEMPANQHEIVGNFEVVNEDVLTRREVLIMGAMAAGSLVTGSSARAEPAAQPARTAEAPPAHDFNSPVPQHNA